MRLITGYNFFALIAFIGLSACSPTIANQTIPTAVEDYYLGVGDRLEITVYNQEKLSGEFTVGSSGNIAFPLLESVPAQGLTTEELEEVIKLALHPDYLNDPKVSIQILNRRNIYILGEVETPGKYEYTPNMTLLQAIATAEGYTSRAAEGHAEIKRTKDDVIEIFKGDEHEILKPGDVIIIKRRWF
jgi:polysaccharide export outer membrane protein